MRAAMLNGQSLAILASLAIHATKWLPFTFMLAGISPSNFFTARAAEHVPRGWSRQHKRNKSKHLAGVQQCLTLASQLLYDELE